jgi:3-hydroxyacyl-[acyl-carrier-protein] dehydratase
MSDSPVTPVAEKAEPDAVSVNPDAPFEKTTMDIVEIMAILPHRYPFLLIDRVIEMERRTRIVAIKNVTVNEPHFTGHFPDYPIMPGVLTIEAMAQAGGALLLNEIPDRENKLMVFTGIEEARFRRPVVPGDQLRIEVTVLNWRSRVVKMKGVCTVEGKVAADAIITCQLVPRVRKPKVEAAAVETVVAGASAE